LVGAFLFFGRGGLWAGHALGGLGEYPFLRVRRLAVSPLRRGTFSKRRKGNRKGLLLRSALAGSCSFAAGSIRAQRLRFASLHLLPLCLAAPDGRCAPTPGSIPPLSLPTSPVDQKQDQKHSSLRSLCRSCRGLRSFAFAFLWERAPAWLVGAFLFFGRGGLWAGHALGGLGEYPLLRGLLITVPPLRRVTFSKRRKGNRKGLLLRSALAGSGSFAAGSIRAQRLRFASLHLLPLCLAAPDGRCAPTPGSIPPLSLPTSPVDQDQEHSSLRSLLSGAALPRAAALLCFCGSEPAREGGLAADLILSFYLSFALEHAGRFWGVMAVEPTSHGEIARVDRSFVHAAFS